MKYNSIENLTEYEIKMLYDDFIVDKNDNLMISGNCTNFYVLCDDGRSGTCAVPIGSHVCGTLPWITPGFSYYGGEYTYEVRYVCGSRIQKANAYLDSCGPC